MTETRSLYLDAQLADDIWSDELRRVFGDDAGDARYTTEGTSTPELARRCAEFLKANAAWMQAMRETREWWHILD